MKNLLFGFAMLFTSIGFSQSINVKSVALDGYDLVSYFTKNQAIQGTDKLSVEYEGAHFYFSSIENLGLFEANPKKYLPECGGFCATGVAVSNGKFPVDPENFIVTDGKLYLFYNGPYQGAHFDGKEHWVKDEKTMSKKADTNWSTLKSK